MAKHLRKAGLLASAIGLPGEGDGLRLGTPEVVRWGVGVEHAEHLAEFIAEALGRDDPEALAAEVAAFRTQFDTVHYVS